MVAGEKGELWDASQDEPLPTPCWMQRAIAGGAERAGLAWRCLAVVSAAMVALRVCGVVCAAVVKREPVSMSGLRGWFGGGFRILSDAPPTPPPTQLRSLGDSLTLSPHSLRPRKVCGAKGRSGVFLPPRIGGKAFQKNSHPGAEISGANGLVAEPPNRVAWAGRFFCDNLRQTKLYFSAQS
jgi:hypothetical protein